MFSNISNYPKYFSHFVTKNFARSLFSIFIPIYLYANGFSLFQVGIFYLIQELINFIFTYTLYQKVHKWGVRNIMVTAVVAQVILILLVYNFLTPTYLFLIILAFFRGIHDSFYWGAHGMFLVHLSGKKTGHFLGKWYFLTTIAQVVIIPLSGYVLDNYSAFWLVVTSVIIYSISIIPLLSIKLTPLKNNVQIQLSKFIKKSENQYITVVSHLNEFFTKINDTLIPLFIFFLFGKFVSIGIAAVFVVFGEGIYSLLIGNSSDNVKNRKKLLYFNIISYLLLLILLIFINNYVLFVIVLILAFFKAGSLISSETGINKSCQDSECYSKKILSRLGENVAGMFIGVAIIIAGLIGFNIVFLVCSVYILLVFLVIKRFVKYI